MFLNPVTVEIILRYVADLCRQLSHCEGVIHTAASAGRSSSSSSGVKEAKARLGPLQQEVETVCQLLVTVGKHSPRSFTEVAGREDWLSFLCKLCCNWSLCLGNWTFI